MALQRQILNQTFEDIVQQCGVEPTEGNVQQWVAKIGAVLNLKLRYSPLLHQRLVDRYKNYARCLKMKRGGHGRARYRSQAWTVPIEDADVDSVLLQQQVTELTNKVSTLERELLDSVASLKRSRMESDQPSVCSPDAESLVPTGIATKKLCKPIGEYSKSHYQRLKKAAVAECSASLSVLKDIGHTPLSVRTFNTVTNQPDELHLEVKDKECDEEEVVISNTYVL